MTSSWSGGDDTNNSAALRGSDMQQALRGAKHAIEVLQREWWNASLHTWGDVEAWQRCVIADALITYTLLAQDYNYVDVIEKAVKNRSGLSSNDDDLWSAIAALKTFFLTGDVWYWNDLVQYEYKNIKERWLDNHCRGGVWQKYHKAGKDAYKNAITNEQCILFLTLMRQAAPHSAYLDEAQSAWKWFEGSGMINEQRVPNAGTSERPSIATLGDTLYAAWKGAGSDARIWFSTKARSGAWSAQTRFVIPGLTERGPSLAAYRDRLYDVYSGSESKNRDSIL